MQTKDIYGKTLSDSLQTAITQPAQYVKPRVIAEFNNIRYMPVTSVTTFPKYDYPNEVASYSTYLKTDVSASSNTITVFNGFFMPLGDTENTGDTTKYFTVTLDKGAGSVEDVLIKSRNLNTLYVAQRGYNGTTAQAHLFANGATLNYNGKLDITNTIPYYYDPSSSLINGLDYESFLFAATDEIDNTGYGLTANGNFITFPDDLSDNFKYGFEGDHQLNNSTTTYGYFITGGANPSVAGCIDGTYYPNLTGTVSSTEYTLNSHNQATTVCINFDTTVANPMNKIKITTSKYKGPVKSFRLQIKRKSDLASYVVDATYTFDVANGEFEKLIPFDATYTDVESIRVTSLTSQFTYDRPRFISINPVWQVDISDYIISLNSERVRDLHETTLPIAGTSQSSVTLVLDNTDKSFSLTDPTAKYGQYINKDIPLYISNGWKTNSNAPDSYQTFLTTAITAATNTTLVVNDAYFLPLGDTGATGQESKFFIITIDRDKSTEEKILIKSRTDTTLSISKRGYANTTAVAHSAGAIVDFETFEFIPIGTYFLEDASGGTNDMQITLNLQNRFKFFNDQVLSNGFFRMDTTVADAVHDLLCHGNFPRKDIERYSRYSEWPAKNGAVTHFTFDEDPNNDNQSDTPLGGFLVKIKILNANIGLDPSVMYLGSNSIATQQSLYDGRNDSSLSSPDLVFYTPCLALGKTLNINNAANSIVTAPSVTIDGYSAFGKAFTPHDYYKHQVTGANLNAASNTIVFTLASYPYYGSGSGSNGHRFKVGDFVSLYYGTNTANTWHMFRNPGSICFKVSNVTTNTITIYSYYIGSTTYNPTGNWSGDSNSFIMTTPKPLADILSSSTDAITASAGSKSMSNTDSWLGQNDPNQPWWWKSNANPMQGTIEGYYLANTISTSNDKLIIMVGNGGARYYYNDIPALTKYGVSGSTSAFGSDSTWRSGLNRETYTGDIRSYAFNSFPPYGTAYKLKVEFFSPKSNICITGAYASWATLSNGYVAGNATTDYGNIGPTGSVTLPTTNPPLARTSAFMDKIRIVDRTMEMQYIGLNGVSANGDPSTISQALSYNYQSDTVALPSIYVKMKQPGALPWDTSGGAVALNNNNILVGSPNTALSSIIILGPVNPISANINQTGDWSIEMLVKFPYGPFAGGDGEYVSSWSNANSTYGFEFFYLSASNHGIKVKSNNNATVNVASVTAMSNSSGWHHIAATYSKATNILTYYVDGTQHANGSFAGSEYLNWGTLGNNNISIGGRGGYISNTFPYTVSYPTQSSNTYGINLMIDDFATYRRCLTADQISKRYIEANIVENKKYPYIYSFNKTIFEALNDISFSELGRVYIDENDKARYEGYYEFWEPSIAQHANIQKTASDTDYIVNASLTKTVQINSVTVKVAGVTAISDTTQSIWRAPDNSTLGVIQTGDTVDKIFSPIKANSFVNIPFPTSGYIKIENDCYRYDSINSTHFCNISRPYFIDNTYVYSTHNANIPIREIKVFNFEYDKHPVYQIKPPFITGIEYETPDQIDIIRWRTTPFKAELILGASKYVATNTVVFIEGTDPLTQKVSYTSIAGVPIDTTQTVTQASDQTATNSNNRRRYGLKEVTIDTPLITTEAAARDLASFVIDHLSDPIPVISVETILMPTLQIGDRIRIGSLDQLGISNTDYWVTKISTTTGSGFTQQMDLRKVT